MEKKNVLSKLFEIGIFIKGLEGVLEIISGALLTYSVKTDQLLKIVLKLTSHELVQDPTDFLANKLVDAVKNTTPLISFEMWYLLINGSIKTFLSVMLLKRKIWAYPVAIYIYSALSILLIFEFFKNWSIVYLVFFILEISVVIFTIIDYKEVLKRYKKV